MPKPSIDGLRLRAKRRLRFGRLRKPGCDDRSGETHPAPPAFPAPPARIITEVIRPFRGVTPRVHPTAFIDDSAQVIGHVEFGEESGVWLCAVVRGDVHWIGSGRRSNVQD